MVEAEAIANTKLYDPKLDVSGIGYSTDPVTTGLSEMNRDNLKGFFEWAEQDITQDINSAYQTANRAARHPINFLANADMSLLRAAGTLLFNSAEIGRREYKQAAATYNEYSSADSVTQRKMLARGAVRCCWSNGKVWFIC